MPLINIGTKEEIPVAFRIFSFSSKLEPEPDLQTGSGQNVPALQHCTNQVLPPGWVSCGSSAGPGWCGWACCRPTTGSAGLTPPSRTWPTHSGPQNRGISDVWIVGCCSMTLTEKLSLYLFSGCVFALLIDVKTYRYIPVDSRGTSQFPKKQEVDRS